VPSSRREFVEDSLPVALAGAGLAANRHDPGVVSPRHAARRTSRVRVCAYVCPQGGRGPEKAQLARLPSSEVPRIALRLTLGALAVIVHCETN